MRLGTDNQQGSLGRLYILLMTPQRLHAELQQMLDDDIVQPLWRHRESLNKAPVAEAVGGSPPF